jgi:hypothetical protein
MQKYLQMSIFFCIFAHAFGNAVASDAASGMKAVCATLSEKETTS